MMRNLVLILLVICLIASVGCTSLFKKPVTVEFYTIEVSGTSGLKFAGRYGGITLQGEKVTQSVTGIVPAQYTIQGTSETIIYCSFVKGSEAGTLNVQILKNGQLATQGGTAAPNGSVTLATN
jgi:hypothetical protein